MRTERNEMNTELKVMKTTSVYVVTAVDGISPYPFIAAIYPTRAMAIADVARYKTDPFTVTVKYNEIKVSAGAVKVLLVQSRYY